MTSYWSAPGECSNCSDATGSEAAGNEFTQNELDGPLRKCSSRHDRYGPRSFRSSRTNEITTFPLQEVFRLCSSSPSSSRQVGFKPKMPLIPAALMKGTRLVFRGIRGKKKKKDTCATLSKAVNVLSHNSQGPRLGSTSLWEKPRLDMVEPASLASGSPGRGGHVWKLLPQSISKVQVLKYLSRAELHPCGGPSEHSSCTLKGYSESRAWGGYTLKSMGVPLTEWLSAECNGSPLIYCQYVGQGAFDKVCFKKKKKKKKNSFLNLIQPTRKRKVDI